MALPAGFELEQAAPPLPQAESVKLPPGFEMETSSGIPKQRRSFADVPGEALTNLGPSAANFYQGLVTAITNPAQTVTGVLDIGAGALQNMLPKELVDLVNKIDNNPEASKRAVDMANAVGGMYRERYGSAEKIKNTLATDPVGAASDLSTLFTGSAGFIKGYGRVGSGVLGKVVGPSPSQAATTVATFDAIAKPFEIAAKYTNPLAPVTAATGYGLALGAKGTGNVVDALTGLGWGERVASEAVETVTKQSSDTDRNALLRSALAHLSGSKSVGA